MMRATPPPPPPGRALWGEGGGVPCVFCFLFLLPCMLHSLSCHPVRLAAYTKTSQLITWFYSICGIFLAVCACFSFSILPAGPQLPSLALGNCHTGRAVRLVSPPPPPFPLLCSWCWPCFRQARITDDPSSGAAHSATHTHTHNLLTLPS